MKIDATNSEEPADVLVQRALHQHERDNQDRTIPLPLPTIEVILPGNQEENQMMAQKLLRQGIAASNITYSG